LTLLDLGAPSFNFFEPWSSQQQNNDLVSVLLGGANKIIKWKKIYLPVWYRNRSQVLFIFFLGGG
jgi:hypothetical protein